MRKSGTPVSLLTDQGCDPFDPTNHELVDHLAEAIPLAVAAPDQIDWQSRQAYRRPHRRNPWQPRQHPLRQRCSRLCPLNSSAVHPMCKNLLFVATWHLSIAEGRLEVVKVILVILSVCKYGHLLSIFEIGTLEILCSPSAATLH
jgi:hypothetical protein